MVALAGGEIYLIRLLKLELAITKNSSEDKSWCCAASRRRQQTAKMATTSNMFMYSLTLQPPTTITHAILGQFSGTREQQILTVSGSRLSLLRPDPSQSKVITLVSHEIFGIIRNIASFRLAGSNKGTYQRISTLSFVVT
jgi:hypothetical protein